MYDDPDRDIGPYGHAEEDLTRPTRTVIPSTPAGDTYGSDDAYVEDRQRERFGGISWGADFFGWLTAVAMGALLAAAVAVALTAAGRADHVMPPAAGEAPGAVGIVAAAILFGILVVAYFAGGYVAGRMSRFDGGRQGFGVWIIGLVLTGAVAAVVVTWGQQAAVLGGVDLPTPPVPVRALDIRAVVAVAAALVCSLLAAIAGGKVGCRYHRKVDEAALG